MNIKSKIAIVTGASSGIGAQFSKDLIRQAIDSSKGLTDNQLENLKKYSARVTSIT